MSLGTFITGINRSGDVVSALTLSPRPFLSGPRPVSMAMVPVVAAVLTALAARPRMPPRAPANGRTKGEPSIAMPSRSSSTPLICDLSRPCQAAVASGEPAWATAHDDPGDRGPFASRQLPDRRLGWAVGGWL